MNFINIIRGDEGESIRLLSSFQKQFPYKILELYKLRDHVFRINTSRGNFILKGYPSYSRLKLQETFISTLHREGFNKTYSFMEFNQDPIVFQDHYFGCLPFIEPHHKAFTYQSHNERLEGLELLDEFHRVTMGFVQRYQTILPHHDMEKKWTDRYNLFHQNIAIVAKYIPYEALLEWIGWAEWSLDGIRKHINELQKEPPVILHGDVAHHNFLRKKDGKIILIDFDLISIGPCEMDLLQYANRILSFIDWNFNTLSQYTGLSRLVTNDLFIYALAFPTDLFREWNRIVREGLIRNDIKLQHVLNLSIASMKSRQQFMLELKKLVQ